MQPAPHHIGRAAVGARRFHAGPQRIQCLLKLPTRAAVHLLVALENGHAFGQQRRTGQRQQHGGARIPHVHHAVRHLPLAAATLHYPGILRLLNLRAKGGIGVDSGQPIGGFEGTFDNALPLGHGRNGHCANSVGLGAGYIELPAQRTALNF